MSIYQDHRPGNTDDLFLKLLDGDKVKGRIVSEPAISVYTEGQRPRYSWVFFTRDKNGKPVNKPQILTKGISIYNQIADLVEDWGDPNTFDITIKRTGSGLNDTEYSVVPVKESATISKVQQEEIDKIDLPGAIKGKWLREFMQDDRLPNPIVMSTQVDTVEPMPGDEDAPIDLDSIPY